VQRLLTGMRVTFVVAEELRQLVLSFGCGIRPPALSILSSADCYTDDLGYSGLQQSKAFPKLLNAIA